MAKLRYQIVDVFSSRPLGGNPLCVVLDECEPESMQAIAREVNLSETTFPVVTGRNAYSLRIFTTAAEFPFAGHPSLGTAWALGENTWTQTTSGATVQITSDKFGAKMTQPPPDFEEFDGSQLQSILGLKGMDAAIKAGTGGTNYLVAITKASLDEVELNEYQAKSLISAHGAVGLAACRRVNDRELELRVFFPGDSVLEDPGTGSLAGPLGVFAHTRWGLNVDLTVKQGDHIGRPCRIDVHGDQNDVRIGGAVSRFAEGVMTI